MKWNFSRMGIGTGIIAVCVLFVISACSRKIAFTNSSVVPAARGYVQIKKDKNENYAIDVSINGLAEVERLQGNNKSYVVWMESRGENAKNIGQINSGSKMWSSKLKASFHTVSTAKPTMVFITAEQDGNTQYPGNVIVLTTEGI